MSKKTLSAHFVPFIEAKEALDRKIIEAKEAKEALDRKIKEEGEKAIKAFFKEYFEKHPEVYGVKWNQYVPFFNDGEACTFSLHGVYTYKIQEAFDDEDTPMYANEGAEESYNEEPYTSLEKVEDILETIFGEHARVTVTRNKITTEEYTDHD